MFWNNNKKKIIKLEEQIRILLQLNNFKLLEKNSNDEKITLVFNFNNFLKHSTFYINTKYNFDDINIGANITLQEKFFTKSIINKVRQIATQYNMSCIILKDTHSVLLSNIFKVKKFKDESFLLFVANFQECVATIYNELYKSFNYQELRYLDLSMFEMVDWAIFDPYKYIMERDKSFDGSWDNYLNFLKNNDALMDFPYVNMCKLFEDKNNIPIDLACEYIIDEVIHYISTDKDNN